ncbi:MAG: orotidine 5'-phosphate decarboxylase [Candidatus Methanomethyliaceae archaeon]|nr:orotidine 5'-phosphate decarboxylase [Candidatus Methanomethyliaceae archaeon]
MGGRLFRRITQEKSIVIACDVSSIERLQEIVVNSCDLDLVGAYKIGFSLVLRFGLPKVVSVIRNYSEKPIIYDHQKGATDVPHTGIIFSEALSEAGVDYAIIFPFSGPSTQIAWIESLKKSGVIPIVGGALTISDFLNSNGGYIAEEAALKIFKVASNMGVEDYVLPGNNLQLLNHYKQNIDLIVKSPIYYLPGLGAQGGDIRLCGKIMGRHWHAIVGRSVYTAKDIKSALMTLISDLQTD